MKKKIIIILQILSVILYILMIGKKFPIFPQAMSLYELNLPLLELLKKGHILHFPRYMVVYPSIFLGNLLSIDIHIVNTVYSIILLMVIIYSNKFIFILNNDKFFVIAFNICEWKNYIWLFF